ncbi:MAG: radical SAM protein [Anaerolineales bacterium]|nr:radical SAM protein [Anaerolineales bacterium]
MLTYLGNLLKLTRGDFTLDPHIAVYYVTMQCNLNCAYCEDFGSRRNQLVTPAPPLEDAKRILKVIRSGVDRLWLTGGEPLIHPQILDLLTYARKELNFREISLITNGTLLHSVIARSGASRHDEAIPCEDAVSSSSRGLLRAGNHRPRNDVLSCLDHLIISLDSTDPQALNRVSVPDAYADTVIANAREAASLQKKYDFKLIINAVITPETLPGMDKLLAFCTENNSLISFSPQSVNNLPRYELVTSPEYRAFIGKVIQLKKRGAPILGSLSYFKILLDQIPYECYPTLVPRILPDGWLTYPCRPMEKAGGEQGGRAVNLLNVQTWEEAWSIARQKYGEAPTSCVSCFQQCYAEPSLMQARPLEYLMERIRGNELITYAPG